MIRYNKNENGMIKFIYSEKATTFFEILTLLLTAVHTVKSKVEISQNFVAFSEYMNFIRENLHRIDISTTTYLHPLVNVVCECPPKGAFSLVRQKQSSRRGR